MKFKLESPFQPTGDQPNAIESLVEGIATADAQVEAVCAARILKAGIKRFFIHVQRFFSELAEIRDWT